MGSRGGREATSPRKVGEAPGTWPATGVKVPCDASAVTWWVSRPPFAGGGALPESWGLWEGAILESWGFQCLGGASWILGLQGFPPESWVRRPAAGRAPEPVRLTRRSRRCPGAALVHAGAGGGERGGGRGGRAALHLHAPAPPLRRAADGHLARGRALRGPAGVPLRRGAGAASSARRR